MGISNRISTIQRSINVEYHDQDWHNARGLLNRGLENHEEAEQENRPRQVVRLKDWRRET